MCRIRFVELLGVTVDVQDIVCGVVGSHCQCAGYGLWSCGESLLMCRIQFVDLWGVPSMCRIRFVELLGVTVDVQDIVCGVVGSHR